MPDELPEKCPECESSCGWYIHGEYNISVKADGTVSVGSGNDTKYGQKFEAICNNPRCDASVNLYVEAGIIKTGKIAPTGANELIEILEEELPAFTEQYCERCARPFITDIKVGRSRETGGVALRTPAYCGCGNNGKERIRDEMLMRKIADIKEPKQVKERLTQ